MKDLIEALTIFLKYTDQNRVNCEHDTLCICINPAVVSVEDKARLKQLGFTADGDDEHFFSYRFGSC